MRIRYETSVATLVQFLAGVALSFVDGVASIAGGCFHTNSVDCVSNALVSLIVMLGAVVLFGVVLGLGYVAQARRSVHLAYVLIGAEIAMGAIFLFDAKHAIDAVTVITNVLSAGIAAWVIWVAWNLSRTRGGRMVRARKGRR